MPVASNPTPPPERLPLTPERVLRTAMAVADRSGIAAVTMRSIAAELDVKPMSLYHHVANKELILDGVTDQVFAEIYLPTPGNDWREEMRLRAVSARKVLKRHRWAAALVSSRVNPGVATLRHHDAVIGTLRVAGFSTAMVAHAFALLDAYIYGFAIQEATLPMDNTADIPELAEHILQLFAAEEFPHLAAFTAEHVLQPGYDFAEEFDYGLDLVLDGIEAALNDD